MACDTVHCWWTFSGLVGAFLDLAIAYFLLCASAVAYFASKLLSILGLSLPCPCNGLFVVPNSNFCAHRLLVDYPTAQVSNVQQSVKSKFPFDLTFSRGQECHLNTALIGYGQNDADVCVETKDESSCSSNFDMRKSRNLIWKACAPRNDSEFGAVKQVLKEGRFDLKGKRTIHQRTRGGIRRRKKGSTDCVKLKFSSIASCEHPYLDQLGGPESSASPSMRENYNKEDDGELIADMVIRKRPSRDFELNDSLDENKDCEKILSPSQQPKDKEISNQNFDNDQKNMIRALEQALEEEQVNRAALFLELEKERNAAATAADEAMAMILRLQEEKASIEIEARQYQRIIEEKSAYDAEEMNILKEIILRREREKLSLEKEVESYRQIMCLGGKGSGIDVQDINTGSQGLDSSFLDLGTDPVLMLQQLSQSIDRRELALSENSDVISIDKQSSSPATDRELLMQGSEGDCKFMRQESMEKHVLQLSEKTIPIVGKEQDQNRDCAPARGVPYETTETEIYYLLNGENLKHNQGDACHGGKELVDLLFDEESQIQDVHMVVSESKLHKKLVEEKYPELRTSDDLFVHSNNDLSSIAASQQVKDITHSPTISWLNVEAEIKRSTSDTTDGLPPLDPTCKFKLSDWRRNSLPIVDNERLKIDSEVVWLRERLRFVQEERQKLNFSMEHPEREKLHFQLLDDILSRLWEIRQLTESGKSGRENSLPLPSSKVLSKKRRCRSASLEV